MLQGDLKTKQVKQEQVETILSSFLNIAKRSS